MSSSIKEVYRHIQHAEQMYEWHRISREKLRIDLKQLVNELALFDLDQAEEQIARIYSKYDFEIEIEEE